MQDWERIWRGSGVVFVVLTIGAIIGVPIAAALQIVAEEVTAGRRARIAAEDGANKLPT